jgi:hypothetical protein
MPSLSLLARSSGGHLRTCRSWHILTVTSQAVARCLNTRHACAGPHQGVRHRGAARVGRRGEGPGGGDRVHAAAAGAVGAHDCGGARGGGRCGCSPCRRHSRGATEELAWMLCKSGYSALTCVLPVEPKLHLLCICMEVGCLLGDVVGGTAVEMHMSKSLKAAEAHVLILAGAGADRASPGACREALRSDHGESHLALTSSHVPCHSSAAHHP